MKTINNETAKIIREFLESKRKVNMNEVKVIFDHVYAESGGLIYNAHLVMSDMDEIMTQVSRCVNMDECKYHVTILAILFEGCGILPPETSVFYAASNNSEYKFSILVREADALAATKNKELIRAFIKGALSISMIANFIITDGIDEDDSNVEELNNMRNFDSIYAKILSKDKYFDILLHDIYECLTDHINLRFKSKTATEKLSKKAMNTIYQTCMGYRMITGDEESC